MESPPRNYWESMLYFKKIIPLFHCHLQSENLTRTGVHCSCPSDWHNMQPVPLLPWKTDPVSTWNNQLFVWCVCCQQYVLTIAKLQPSGWTVQALDIRFLDLPCNFQAILYDPIDSTSFTDNISSTSKSLYRHHDLEIHGTSSSW